MCIRDRPVTISQANGGERTEYQLVVDPKTNEPYSKRDAWRNTYQLGLNEKNEPIAWKDFNLKSKIGAFVEGGANFLSMLGLPLQFGIGIISVLVACFAATTLDSATRLQRYVIQELGGTLRISPLKNMYLATLLAVVLGGAIAMLKGPDDGPYGSGGMLLWPLFGATNQLLAGLAFLVTAFYLWRRNKPVWFVALPMIFMIFLPGWALVWQLFNSETGWWLKEDKFLVAFIGTVTLVLQIWMVIEALICGPKQRAFWRNLCLPLRSRTQNWSSLVVGHAKQELA